MVKNISIILFIIIISSNLFSQVTEEWVRRYTRPGNFSDEGVSVRNDRFGNTIVTGVSGDSLVTIKYKNNGEIKWTSIFPGPNQMRRDKSLAVDSEGGIYICGWVNLDIFIVKYNPQGVQQWVSTYSSPGYSMDMCVKIAIGVDGYLYFLGNISPVELDFKYLTIKYNPVNGDTLWTKIFDIGAGVGPADMVMDNNCNIFITGVSSAIATIKYDSSGNLRWISELTYGTPFAIGLDKQGNIYVTGEIYSSGEDCKTIKYDSNGVIKWTREYNGGSNTYDVPFSLAVDDSSNVLIAGYSETNGPPFYDEYLVVKYNTNGILQWTARYEHPLYHQDQISKIAVDKYGNSYVTGHTTIYNIQYWDQYTTIKYSNTGSQMWIKNYFYANGNGVANDLVIDSMLNVYITGYSFGIGTGYDIATIKYSQPIGIQPISSEVPEQFSLSQNYPNPFNPVTKIKFDIPQVGTHHGAFVQLIVYDILGREIAVLVNEKLNPGTYEVQWDGFNYPSGVYFYRLVTEGYTETKRMVLLK